MGDTKMETPEIKIEEAVHDFIQALDRLIGDKNEWGVVSCLFDLRFRGAVKRVLHLRNLADGCWSEGDPMEARTYEARASEVLRQFFAYLKDAMEVMLYERKDDIEELVLDTDEILLNLITELRMMGR
jgi:hypothetical protein